MSSADGERIHDQHRREQAADLTRGIERDPAATARPLDHERRQPRRQRVDPRQQQALNRAGRDLQLGDRTRERTQPTPAAASATGG